MTHPRLDGQSDSPLRVDGPPADGPRGQGEGQQKSGAPLDWGARLREWGAKVGDLVEALFPSPEPPLVPIPVPVRRRHR